MFDSRPNKHSVLSPSPTYTRLYPFHLFLSPSLFHVSTHASTLPLAALDLSDSQPRLELSVTTLPHSDVRNQDRYLPIANISRIMKQALPSNGKIAKDAKEMKL